MLKYIDYKKMGRSELGWLDSHFHFSFAEYYNLDNVDFGVLRVLNDDLVKSNTGFGTHPHQDFEIISYVVDGELTHADSMGNEQTLKRGQAQYMSAGTGVTHSEYNYGKDTLRFLQIWFYPDKKGYAPNYGDYKFNWEDRKGKWLPIASGDEDSQFPIQIHSDVHIYATEIAKGDNQKFDVNENRQAYMVLIEGEADVSTIALKARDALEIVEESITIQAKETSHILIIEMAKQS